MRIGMVIESSREFPPDIRVEKEIHALVGAGHDVFVLSPRLRRDSAASEYLAHLGATVDRVRLGEVRRRYVRNAIRALTMYDARWSGHIREFVARHAIEVMHVHDLFLVPVVVRAGHQLGIPVVADLHENMPAAMRAARSNQALWKRLVFGVLNNYRLMRWHEARALRRCHAVIVVVPEAAERIHDYGVAREAVRVVSNTEDETTFRFNPEDADPAIVDRYRDQFVISYIGGMGAHRGLDTTLRALPLIRASLPDVRLLIVGADAQTQRQVAAAAETHGVTEIVDILPWQPFERVNSYVMASDVCLVPHNDFEHTQTTIPHKLFQYMICGKPVLVSDCRPLARVVNGTRAGAVFRANDEVSLARTLIEMAADRGGLADMGARGQRAALGDWSWKKDAAELIALYEDIRSAACAAAANGGIENRKVREHK